MARSCALTAFTILALAFLWSPAGAQERGGACADLRSEWREALARLSTVMEEFRTLKEESVTPRIEAELQNRQRNRTIAEAVQSGLRDRRNRMSQAEKTLEGLARTEKTLYQQFKACVSRDRRRPQGGARTELAGPERERVVGRLSALLADEAFLQYKGQREYGPVDRSYETPQGPSSQYTGRPPEEASPFGRDQGWFGRR